MARTRQKRVEFVSRSTVLNEVMATSDTAIPASIASKAEGIAIFPGTLKAGFIFGGMRGRGILSARTEGRLVGANLHDVDRRQRWPADWRAAADLVLIIMKRRGLEQFVRNQFKLGADAAVAAGPVGRDAQASHRPAAAGRDPQLLTGARTLCRGHRQRQHRARRPRRQSAFLREAVDRRRSSC